MAAMGKTLTFREPRDGNLVQAFYQRAVLATARRQSVRENTMKNQGISLYKNGGTSSEMGDPY